MKADVVVLGAGIVGVSIALHLQAKGRDVVLLDRREPGLETSFGNAGLIERSSVIPYAFPRDIRLLLSYALNRRTDVSYQPLFLPQIATWLARYWWHSSPKRLAQATAHMLPMIERSVLEHDELAQAAGITHLFRRTGWIECLRSQRWLTRAVADAERLESYGLRYRILDQQGLAAHEPHLKPIMAGAIHWLDPVTVSDPGAVVRGYAALFVKRGGRLLRGDALTLRQCENTWKTSTDAGLLQTNNAVIALGPWSVDVLKPLGYRIPMAVKRGYHQHFRVNERSMLTHPVVDVEHGFVLSPMTNGIRLTTGVELAPRDAHASPVQLDKARAKAAQMISLGEPVEANPWMGARPCLPDMLPVIGPAFRHRGLWMAFGHAHHGFTLGPVTGRLIADLMTGEDTGFDATPYRLQRYGSL
ncbi:NAD(P)/FAD-dependent oxidoreductase [Advenella mimigardefordensis]|uniref:Putative FAD-dependent oxidoreductase n=1 Tax=Advenella mimigardefordensis (strain DSM 17166 / LMG 22922 / DPN7) TaxID=1247726 RepID=W0PKQ9_ADVMD|nr:FAD-dependent oxidoreductase [Advenella mimigardefordensis]AHG66140.1 putative FAD-dependent oxidoreductase [Advenella mimigardefordensis DPN7]